MCNTTSDFTASECLQVDSYRGTECRRRKGATVLHDPPADRRRPRYMISSIVGSEPSRLGNAAFDWKVGRLNTCVDKGLSAISHKDMNQLKAVESMEN